MVLKLTPRTGEIISTMLDSTKLAGSCFLFMKNPFGAETAPTGTMLVVTTLSAEAWMGWAVGKSNSISGMLFEEWTGLIM